MHLTVTTLVNTITQKQMSFKYADVCYYQSKRSLLEGDPVQLLDYLCLTEMSSNAND